MRNPTYEQAMTAQSVGFTYHESILLEDIDVGKGLRNQARLLNPIEDELVESYAQADRDGMDFPPLVLWRPGKGRYIPVDGNNRLAAYTRNRRKETDAYVLETQDVQVADRVTWTFNNAVNGKRLSKEECVAHAVSFVGKYSMSQEQAAKEWGVPLAAVRVAVRSNRLKDILAAHGVKKVPDDRNLERLGALESAGEDVLVAAATVVVESGAGPKECDQLVKEVRAGRTHEAKIKAVDEFAQSEFIRQRQAETRGGKIKPQVKPPREQLKEHVHKAVLLVTRFNDKDRKDALKPAPHEYKGCRAEAAELCNHLITLYGLGALLREETA